MPSSGALLDARTIFVPVAQITEQMRPKHKVASENPAGDTVGDVAHQLERSFDMREVKRAARFAPTIS